MRIQNTKHFAQHNWPEGTMIQGGGEFYDRPFVEAFPANTYIRGEGRTIAEAETKAWNQYQREIVCQHEFEPRGYKNGAGFCKHCNRFESHVFTYEEVGAFCVECGVPSYWHVKDNGDILCEHCAPDITEVYPWLKDEEQVEITDADIEQVIKALANKIGVE